MIPTDCSVVRGGNNVKVDPIKLVPGDIISINSGDKIPADVRII
jgi:magnesium-transporting ATPase (P-type)